MGPPVHHRADPRPDRRALVSRTAPGAILMLRLSTVSAEVVEIKTRVLIGVVEIVEDPQWIVFVGTAVSS